jgi:N-methylhydantoinase B
MKKAKLDPIALEIQWKRLVSMVDEASAAFVRTSFSVLVREANDFAVVLTDAEGRSIAQSVLSIPSFIGTLPATVKHFLKRFPVRTLKPGDVMITNDPWMGTGHIHDVNVAMPIFDKGRIVAFAAVVSHMPDIGGAHPQRRHPRDLRRKASRSRQLKLMSGGKADQNLPRHDRAERAGTGADAGRHLGRRWPRAACWKSGLRPLLRDTDLKSLGAEIRRRSETAMRRSIRDVPDGVLSRQTRHDGFEEPILINCT